MEKISFTVISFMFFLGGCGSSTPLADTPANRLTLFNAIVADVNMLNNVTPGSCPLSTGQYGDYSKLDPQTATSDCTLADLTITKSVFDCLTNALCVQQNSAAAAQCEQTMAQGLAQVSTACKTYLGSAPNP